MKNYTFDMTLKAAFTVEAESEEEARRILQPVIDSGFATLMKVTERDDSEEHVMGEVSLKSRMKLAQIDGVDVG